MAKGLTQIVHRQIPTRSSHSLRMDIALYTSPEYEVLTSTKTQVAPRPRAPNLSSR